MIKDSGERIESASGMVRDTQEGKPRFDLMWPKGAPFELVIWTRVAKHLATGATRYAERNWEKGNTQEDVDRAMSSLARHFAQFMAGETDEDHAAAVVTNILFVEEMKRKRDVKAIFVEHSQLAQEIERTPRVLRNGDDCPERGSLWRDRDGDVWVVESGQQAWVCRNREGVIYPRNTSSRFNQVTLHYAPLTEVFE